MSVRQTEPSPQELAVIAATARLLQAQQNMAPCSPVRDIIGDTDISLALQVQQRGVEARLAAGARLVGHKIGLTSRAVQQQLGVGQPDFGTLFEDMQVRDLESVPSERLIQPQAEAEIAFVLGSDLVDGPLELEQVRGAVAYATAALEVVDSRIAGWDIKITDTIADNASSGLFLLGEERVTLDHFEPREAVMHLGVDGSQHSTGRGSDSLGDPLLALAWLARTLRDLGQPLRAGHVVLSGALGPMVPCPPGTRISVEISGLGRLNTTFSASSKGPQ
jgi:2-keto-4-pentenoate hydratase